MKNLEGEFIPWTEIEIANIPFSPSPSCNQKSRDTIIFCPVVYNYKHPLFTLPFMQPEE
jgi:hypothetical protein